MKSEPDVFGIADLERKKVEGWNGVRNYMARNFMRAMKRGDRAIFYHSNGKPSGAAGILEIARTAYPDPTQFDPKNDYYAPKSKPEQPMWDQVDVRFVEKFPRVISADELRGIPACAGMVLFKNSRLSVQPVTDAEYSAVVRAAKGR